MRDLLVEVKSSNKLAEVLLPLDIFCNPYQCDKDMNDETQGEGREAGQEVWI